RADSRIRHRAERVDELVLRRGDEGRLERGDAGGGERLAGHCIAGGVRGGEVDAAEAVDVQVDEPRHGDPATAPAADPGRPDPGRRDPAVHDLDVPGNERALDDSRLDAELHAPEYGRVPGTAGRGKEYPGSFVIVGDAGGQYPRTGVARQYGSSTRARAHRPRRRRERPSAERQPRRSVERRFL